MKDIAYRILRFILFIWSKFKGEKREYAVYNHKYDPHILNRVNSDLNIDTLVQYNLRNSNSSNSLKNLFK